MNENNEIYKSLGQVPELVKLAQNLIEKIEKLIKMVAQAIQRQMTATIPEEEHQRMAKTISHTPCAAPDMTEVANELANSMIKALRRDIHDEAVNAVKEAVKDTPVKVEKNVHYTSSWEMSHIADKALARRFWIMFSVTVLASLLIAIGAYEYFNSKMYLAKQYMEVYNSKYTTDEEREMLREDTFTVGALPLEYHKSPGLVKAKIKRNKQILQQRNEEAKANKGKFSTKMPLER
jgi:hypothetical protein